MDLAKYKELVVNTSLTDAQIEALILKTQGILEDLLGFTLDPDKVEDNDFPDLAPETAFRIFPFNRSDAVSRIDPCTEIHSVRFLRNDGTTEEVDADNYNGRMDRGIINYISFYNTFYPYWPSYFTPSFVNFRCSCDFYCGHVQLLVDADWVWAEDFPNDLLQVWADMVTFYGDESKGIRSQTLGSHSYTKFDQTAPEKESSNLSIIMRYAGPKGTALPVLTI